MIQILSLSACNSDKSNLPENNVNNVNTENVYENQANDDRNVEFDSSVETAVSNNNLIIKRGYSFSEGVAVVLLDINSYWYWSLIDKKGNIIYQSEETTLMLYDEPGCYEAKNGVVIFDNKLITTDGQVLASPETTGYDSIVSSPSQMGGDYFFVTTSIDTYKETRTKIGIIDKTGAWIEEDFTGFDVDNFNCSYVGDNHYCLSDLPNGLIKYVYSPETKKGFKLDDRFAEIRYTKGKGLYSEGNATYKIDDAGNKTKLYDFGITLGEPDELTFCANNSDEEFRSDKEQNGIYDFDGNLIIDLSKYDFEGAPYYDYGRAVLIIKNENNSHFLTIVDDKT